MGKQVVKTIESLYDKYSGMLYGIALEISPTTEQADIILINTFKEIHVKNIKKQENASICSTLIKLLIQTAHNTLKPNELIHNFKLKRFENSPFLQLLLCEQVSMENICSKNRLSILEVSQKIHEEFNTIRNLLNKKKLAFE